MARKRPPASKLPPGEYKYFVPAPGKTAPESPRLPDVKTPKSTSRREAVETSPDAGTKYYIPPKRNYPLPSELSVIWTGTGPDLPRDYQNAEACPDCSSFRYERHAPLCIRNPEARWNLAEAWHIVRTREQIFFGVGHPLTRDADSYMTMERQRKLVKANFVCLYDFPAEGSHVKTIMHPSLLERSVIAEWQRKGKI